MSHILTPNPNIFPNRNPTLFLSLLLITSYGDLGATHSLIIVFLCNKGSDFTSDTFQI